MLGHHTPARETRLMEFHWLADDGRHIVALDSSSSPIMNKKQKQQQKNGPHSAVGNVSGSRCESDCRSRGREFDHGPVPYFPEG